MARYRVTAALVVVAGCIALLSYLGGYILLGEMEHFRGTRFRVYAHEWQARLYEPAARVESSLAGEPVATSYYLTHPAGWRPNSN